MFLPYKQKEYNTRIIQSEPLEAITICIWLLQRIETPHNITNLKIKLCRSIVTQLEVGSWKLEVVDL